MAIITGLVGYWELEDTDDTNAVDSHASYDGTQSGCTDEATGIIANCFSFDGSNDYVEMDTNLRTFLSKEKSWSISLWVKPVDYTAAGVIIQSTIDGTNRMGFYLEGSDMRVSIYTGAWEGEKAGVSANVWYHVVMVRDNGTTYGYLDGTAMTVASNANTSTTTNIRLGAKADGTTPFAGLIDEVGIWEKALTQEEITALYNSGAGLAYPFAEGATTYTKTIVSNLSIKKLSIAQTFVSNAHIKKSGIQKTLTSDFFIKKLEIEGSITSDYFIKKLAIEGSITSDYFIKKTEIEGSITSDYYIKKIGIEGSIFQDAYIRRSYLTKINIGDVWKDITEARINIGGIWKYVIDMKVNIGDVWKDI